MLGKRRTIPVIGNLTSSIITGNRAIDASSPRGPLEFKIRSPRGPLTNHHDLGGVGLGIVAALEKSAQDHHHTINRNLNLNRSNPIPVHSSRIKGRGFEEVEMDNSLEDYTFVTCHKPGNESFTRVYYDGGYVNQERGPKKASEIDRRSSRRPSMFTLSSPARIADFPAVPDSDFLRTCNLCRKKLQGKDIYMYRGEKAFCSTECRDSQILMDEQKENGRSEAHQRSLDVPSSAYKNGYGQILSPGIFAI